MKERNEEKESETQNKKKKKNEEEDKGSLKRFFTVVHIYKYQTTQH